MEHYGQWLTVLHEKVSHVRGQVWAKSPDVMCQGSVSPGLFLLVCPICCTVVGWVCGLWCSLYAAHVVVTDIWTGESVKGLEESLMLSVSPLALYYGLLFLLTHFPPFVSNAFSPCSHREMAADIEAAASRAVSASKQTFSFLMDLLQDNSTEEYISRLTEQWAPKHTPTQTSTTIHIL